MPRLPVRAKAARAQDASTIVTNPAGMTRLPDHMFTGVYRPWMVIFPMTRIMRLVAKVRNVMNLFPMQAPFIRKSQ